MDVFREKRKGLKNNSKEASDGVSVGFDNVECLRDFGTNLSIDWGCDQ